MSLTSNNFTVYIHIFPNNKVYIGITSQKPKQRWNNGKGYRNSTRIYNAIQKYGWENIEHKVLFDNLTKEEAEQKEKDLIQQYKSYDDKYGYNLELGGNLCKEISQETRRKMSEMRKGKNNPMYGKGRMKGKHWTQQHKKKLSEIMNSPEVHEKLSKANSGKNNPMYGVRLPEYILEKRRKKVLCIETNIIYNSLKEASQKTNINMSCISECCHKKQQTAGKYHWKYL